MTEADFIIIATAIAVMGVIIVGVIGNAAHGHEDRERFGARRLVAVAPGRFCSAAYGFLN
ncbi:MAG TPA: hypothetical protein VGU20_20720 [Stellaceae bacterium]|nr:hypothetical protein [Stellaceae bacterium]